MYKILKNTIEMDDYSVQKLSNLQPPEPFEWNTVEGTELNVNDCIGGKGKIEVKGNTEQEQLSGKNLLNIANGTYTKNGVTAVVENGKITLNGTATKLSFVEIPFEREYDGSIISLSANNSDTVGSADEEGNYAAIRIADQWIIGAFLGNRNATRTAQLNGTFSNLTIRTGAGLTYNNFVLYPQLEIGQPTSYEPYCGGQASPNPDYPQEIKVVTGDNVVKHCGKNLFDKDNANIINAGISSKVISTSEYNRLLYIPVKSSTTYTIKRRNDGDVNRFRVGSCTVIPANNVSVPNSKEKDNETNITITTGVNDKYLAVMYYRTYETVLTEQQILNSIQIEEGTTATPYEEYREEEYELSLGTMELCKIGDYSDILFKNEVGDENYNAELEDGAWYKKGVIQKEIFDGSIDEGWQINSGAISDKTIYLTSDAIDNKLKENYMGISNYLINSRISLWSTEVQAMQLMTNVSRHIRLRVDKTTASNTDGFRTWLSTHNLELYYASAETTYTKITDSTLISQLEALKKAKWFKGINRWWTETDNLEPVLKGTYRQAINE